MAGSSDGTRRTRACATTSCAGRPRRFGAALLLTGDQRYAQVLRGQIDNLYKASKVENGKLLLPRFYGDQGWYGYHEVGAGPSGSLGNLANVLVDLYMWSLLPRDLERLPKSGWTGYLQTRDAAYPLTAFQAGLDEVRRTGQRLRGEAGSSGRGRGNAGPPLMANPVSTTALINLTMGANDPGGSTHGPLPLHALVRHFDPERKRAGLPEDVAALVEQIQPESVTLTLVNINPLTARTVQVQMGAYGEHHAISVAIGQRVTPVNAPAFTVRLAAGSWRHLDDCASSSRVPAHTRLSLGPRHPTPATGHAQRGEIARVRSRLTPNIYRASCIYWVISQLSDSLSAFGAGVPFCVGKITRKSGSRIS